MRKLFLLVLVIGLMACGKEEPEELIQDPEFSIVGKWNPIRSEGFRSEVYIYDDCTQKSYLDFKQDNTFYISRIKSDPDQSDCYEYWNTSDVLLPLWEITHQSDSLVIVNLMHMGTIPWKARSVLFSNSQFNIDEYTLIFHIENENKMYVEHYDFDGELSFEIHYSRQQ